MSAVERKIIKLLVENPLISNAEIVRRLRISPNLVRRVIDSLMISNRQNVQENTEVSKQERVFQPFLFTVLDPSKLGFTAVSFMVEVRTMTQEKAVIFFCDHHPFTTHRLRVFGGNFQGLFVRFKGPERCISNLAFSFQRLQEENLITSYRHILHDEKLFVHTGPDISAFDLGTNTWNFSLDQFDESLNSERGENTRRQSRPRQQQEPLLEEWDPLDLMLLREWADGLGLRKSNNQVLRDLLSDSSRLYHDYKTCDGSCPDLSCRNLHLDRYVIAQRKEFLLSSGIIVGCEVVFVQQKLGTFNQILFEGEAGSDLLNHLTTALTNRQFPFTSVLAMASPTDPSTPSPVRFFWWMKCPPNHMNALVQWMMKRSANVQVFLPSTRPEDYRLNINYHHSLLTQLLKIKNDSKGEDDDFLTQPLQTTLKRFCPN